MWCPWLWIPEGPGINGSRRHVGRVVSLDFLYSCETCWKWVLVPFLVVSSDLPSYSLGYAGESSSICESRVGHKVGARCLQWAWGEADCHRHGSHRGMRDVVSILSFTRFIVIYRYTGALHAWIRTVHVLSGVCNSTFAVHREQKKSISSV